MKGGRTRLAHKAEHAVDLETGAVVGVSVQDADAGDTQTMIETLVIAAEQVDAVLPAGPGIAELVCDKGYHSNQTLVTLAEVGIRSYVSEPDRGQRHWRGKAAARDGMKLVKRWLIAARRAMAATTCSRSREFLPKDGAKERLRTTGRGKGHLASD